MGGRHLIGLVDLNNKEEYLRPIQVRVLTHADPVLTLCQPCADPVLALC